MAKTDKQQTGSLGERAARRRLEEKGYKILEINWRHRRGELDLIVEKDSLLIFVEVKTRSTDRFGLPEAAVSPAKQKILMSTADAYRESVGWTGECRFDVVAVVLKPKLSILHIEDAFY